MVKSEDKSRKAAGVTIAAGSGSPNKKEETPHPEQLFQEQRDPADSIPGDALATAKWNNSHL